MADPLRVFISYARQDIRKVRNFYKKLKDESMIETWFDEEGLYVGQKWSREIKEYIKDKADIFIFFVSKHSVTKIGFVQKELSVALDKSGYFPPDVIFIIPVRLDKSAIPAELSQYHWVDYFQKNNSKPFSDIVKALKKRGEEIGVRFDEQFLYKFSLGLKGKDTNIEEIPSTVVRVFNLSDADKKNIAVKIENRKVVFWVKLSERQIHEVEKDLRYGDYSKCRRLLKYKRHDLVQSSK